MKGYTYILKCSDDSFYTGSTKDLDRRLAQHQNGEGAKHTAARLPVKLVYSEEFERIDEAFYREKQIQNWSRAKKEALINNQIQALKEMAECKNESHYKNQLGDRAKPRS
jgi:putative endonuclease